MVRLMLYVIIATFKTTYYAVPRSFLLKIIFMYVWKSKRKLRYFSNPNTTLFVWSKSAQFVIHSQLHFSNFDEERVVNTEKWKKKLTVDNKFSVTKKINEKMIYEHYAHSQFLPCFPQSIPFFIFRYSRLFLRRNLKKEIDCGKHSQSQK